MKGELEELRRSISLIVGERWVSEQGERLEAYGRDAWPRVFLAAKERRGTRLPDMVVWPRDVEQVAQIVRLARETKTPIIPYGAGSGVCGGTYALRGGIVLDVKRLDDVGAVDPQDRLVTVGCGAIGEHLERRLNAQGYTLGHFPSSIYCSTVGGWVAGRSAGQMSGRYGKIEDMVSGLTFVDGTGEIRRLEPRPRAGDGPDLAQTFIGSEGVLGVATEATLRVRRLPVVRKMRGVLMPSLDAGLTAIRRMFAAGHRPAVVRLYDPLDTLVNKGKGTDTGSGGGFVRSVGKMLSSGSGGLGKAKQVAIRTVLSKPRFFGELFDKAAGACMLVMGSEGQEERLVALEAEETLAICLQEGGEDLGAGPGEHWLAHRYAVSYKLSPALDLGLFVDTLETAGTWTRLQGLYHGVRQALRDHAFVMAHFSHAYEDGCSIYFTLAGIGSDLPSREEGYDKAWRAALEAVVATGGTISHHHGVGMSKQAFMVREHGEAGMALLRSLKHALDPDGMMNPGKLGLGDGPALPGEPWRVSRCASERVKVAA